MSITILSVLEEQVELHVSQAVRKFQSLPAETLARRPSNGGWSVAECLCHLNSYGDYYLPAIEKGLACGYPVSTTFSSSWLGAYFTRLMQPGEKMKKMKAFKNHTPPPEIDPVQVVVEFIHQQETLLRLLRLSRSADLNRIRIGISILPWMKLKLGDVFQFVVAHQERHMQQAMRVLSPS